MKDNIKVRQIKTKVNDLDITFNEEYMVNEQGNEIFNRDLEIVNDIRLYDIYKKKKGLLTSEEIKDLRKKYKLNQKEFAKILGLGEITIHRFENGSIQTESTDSTINLSSNPHNMKLLLINKKEKFEKDFFDSTMAIINELCELHNHKIIPKEAFLLENPYVKTISANLIAEKIIVEYNKRCDILSNEYDTVPVYLTNLKLQKLLYYVQAMSLHLFNKPAFDDYINAWHMGPVVNTVYQTYKCYGKNEIKASSSIQNIPNGIEEIIENVIIYYGDFEANKLVDLTHNETPFKITKHNDIISNKTIKDYFDRVYSI